MPGSSHTPSGLPKEYWYDSEGLVDSPWEFPTKHSKRGEERVFFHPDRNKQALLGGGTVEVQVFLAGKWHWVKFATDGEAFLKLSKLPERARTLLLDSLALVPVRANLLKGSASKRPRGNSKRDADFWRNIDYWGPAASAWAKKAIQQKQKTTVIKRVMALAKKSRLRCKDAGNLASAICILAWRAIHAINPARFPLPRGKDLQKAVVHRIAGALRAGNPVYGPDMEKFVQALLRQGKNSEAVCRDIIVIGNREEFGPTVKMSDFRMF
ncbi:MAG: hypothetical protein P0120_07780 [Nitrospira sp.]|nr:hypothetical protein [Nitrospira sp.]